MGKAKRAKPKHRSLAPYSKNASNASSVSSSKSKVSKPKYTAATRYDQELPFDPEDNILLVGEGDFSFAASLQSHHNCTSLVASTFEARQTLLAKYPQASSHISQLEEEGHTVLYSIDATKLGHPHTPGAASLRKSRFNVIIFNFPHVGGKSTDVNRQVRANQDLVVRFLENAKILLMDGGKILLTIFEGQPYELWGVRNLARHVALKVERSMKFDADMYPGYRHARTLGNIDRGGGWKGENRKSRMFVFVDKDKGSDQAHKGKRSRGSDSDEDR